MDTLIREFSQSYSQFNGPAVAATLNPFAPIEGPTGLRAFHNSTNPTHLKRDIKNALLKFKSLTRLTSDEVSGWCDVFSSFWRLSGLVIALADGDGAPAGPSRPTWQAAYDAARELSSNICRGYTNHGFDHWTYPLLYTTGTHLRTLAIRADAERNAVVAAAGVGGAGADPNTMVLGDDFDPELEMNQTLRDAEQQLKRIFTLCLSDRAPVDESRKWALYYVVNLLFKTYFKLNSAALSRTILKALSAYQGDMPPLEQFPAAQRVTFKYYEGVLSFLEENYLEAENHLTEAWQLCHKDAIVNKEQILTYLIPCHLLTTHTLPTTALLAPFPSLHRLFTPLSTAIKNGDLAAFDAALAAGEDEFIRRRIYLTLERGRDIVLRNLLRKVFIVGGFDPAKDGEAPIRRTRIPVVEFEVAVSLASERRVDPDEVECMLANMIYKNLMKGYIARDRGIVVLSKSGAFPGTGL